MNKYITTPTLKKIIFEAIVLCCFACSVGLMVNFKLIFNAFSGGRVSPPVVEKSLAGNVSEQANAVVDSFPSPVVLEELDALLRQGALLVDSRSRQDYQSAHPAGAVSLPLAQVEKRLADFKLKVPLETPLITFCSGYGCPDSFDLGVRLLKAGYQQVLVYEGGFPEWRDAGKAVRSGE